MRHADLVVVGGGLAGALAVEAAVELGRDVAWIDAGQRRASDAPCALVHPFVGGSFTPRPSVAAAWNASSRWFARRPEFVHRAPVRRALPATRSGDRLLRSWEHADALARDLFDQVVPPSADSRIVEYGPVFAVELARLLRAESARLEQGGVLRLGAYVEAIEPGVGGRWTLRCRGGCVAAETVVVASGAGSRSLLRPWMDTAALSLAEGVLAYAEGPPLRQFSIFGGHASSGPRVRAWGATYRMLDVADVRGHTEQLKRIDARLRRLEPELPALADARRWGATRLVDRLRRQPWVRPVAPGLLAFTAFGSQGCLWGPWCAERLRVALRTDDARARAE